MEKGRHGRGEDPQALAAELCGAAVPNTVASKQHMVRWMLGCKRCRVKGAATDQGIQAADPQLA
jgi:hypothetical protein